MHCELTWSPHAAPDAVDCTFMLRLQRTMTDKLCFDLADASVVVKRKGALRPPQYSYNQYPLLRPQQENHARMFAGLTSAPSLCEQQCG